MLKNILKLEGAQSMSTLEQKATQGGIIRYCCEWAEVNGRETCIVWSRYGVCP